MGVGAQTPQRVDLTGPVVYYIRKGDHIKIGYSRNLGRRMKRLQPDEILAVEPGNTSVEAKRHREFTADHIDHPQGTEWFTYSLFLAEHIAALASTYRVPELRTLKALRRARKAAATWHPEYDTYAQLTDDELVELGIAARRQMTEGRRVFIEECYRLNQEHGWSTTRIAAQVDMSFSQIARHIRNHKAKLAVVKEA